MIAAIFEHLEGKEICSTPEEVRAVMDKMVDGGNAFNIYREQDVVFPYLSILTKGSMPTSGMPQMNPPQGFKLGARIWGWTRRVLWIFTSLSLQ